MVSRGRVLPFILLVFLFASLPAWGGEVTSGIAEVNGTKLYYEAVGEGQPLVLVHAGSFDRRIWDDQFTACADHYKVLRYDVRGHGKSALPTKPYSDTEDLYSLLKWLHVEKAHLVCLSLGGRILIDFALAHPEIVDTLILVAPGLSGYTFFGAHIQGWIKIVTAIQHDDGTPVGELWHTPNAYPPCLLPLPSQRRLAWPDTQWHTESIALFPCERSAADIHARLFGASALHAVCDPRLCGDDRRDAETAIHVP